MLGWRWLAIAGLLAGGLALQLGVDDRSVQWSGVFSLLAGFALLVGWAKTYRLCMVLARETSQRLDDRTVRVELNEQAIQSCSAVGSTITRWEHITKRATTNRFMVLFAGKQPVTCLPLAALSAEVKETIERRTAGL